MYILTVICGFIIAQCSVTNAQTFDKFEARQNPTITTRDPPTPSSLTVPSAIGCKLPDQPKYGTYKTLQCISNDPRPECSNTPGTDVPSNWLLGYTCNSGYFLNKSLEYSMCRNGDWLNPLACVNCGVQEEGNSTNQGKFPWLAAIYYLNSSQQWEQRCCGTLITPHIILTAAHCLVHYGLDNNVFKPKDLRVGLGKFFRDFYANETSSVISEVKEVIVPRYYSGAASHYALDIGLLDLVDSVQVTSFIMPACVDWSNMFSPPSNTEGVFAGWGYTEEGKPSDVVQSGRLKYIEYDQCLGQLRPPYKNLLTHDKLCSEHIDGKKIDRGDAGAAFTVINPNGQHYVIGVVSTKIPTVINLFTNIKNSEHHAWMEQEKNRLSVLHRK